MTSLVHVEDLSLTPIRLAFRKARMLDEACHRFCNSWKRALVADSKMKIGKYTHLCNHPRKLDSTAAWLVETGRLSYAA